MDKEHRPLNFFMQTDEEISKTSTELDTLHSIEVSLWSLYSASREITYLEMIINIVERRAEILKVCLPNS